MALRGVRVIELAGLAPAPMAGMVLADFGASVIRVDRVKDGVGGGSADSLCRGKRSVALDLKLESGRDLLRQLLRTGVMERMGLGPDSVLAQNPRLVYARMTGFGQTGPMAPMAGHDINYIASSGVLGILGKDPDPPVFPTNLLGDFAGGGLCCAFGIVAALMERTRSGRGQVVDAAMADGSAYVASFRWTTRHMYGGPRGHNMLDGGCPFYACYETADQGQFMAVGALEPQFYRLLVQGLGLDQEPEFVVQMDMDQWPAMRARLAATFRAQPRAHWERVFAGSDACVTPVLDPEEAPTSAQCRARGMFVGPPGEEEPAPHPRLSRTPAQAVLARPQVGQHTREVLRTELGLDARAVDELVRRKVVRAAPTSRL